MADTQETVERRRRQRFVAKRRGEYCFWARIGERRLPLLDLSLEGFGVAAESAPVPGESFDFVLERFGVPDRIAGQARVMNRFETDGGTQVGVLFEGLSEADRERLKDWLTAHVLINASVPITERDASNIVSGPSLV
ncbi:MAG: PilZ domain-containing protein [Rhodocyclaceae bacterium]